MSDSPSSHNNGDRGPGGRFAKGNKLAVGFGNPVAKRTHELTLAVRSAATPEAVLAVLEALHTRALAGDVAAASVWLQRVVGPARHLVDVELPTITDAASASDCFRGIMQAVAGGGLDVASAEKLASLAHFTADAVVYEALASRVAALEATR